MMLESRKPRLFAVSKDGPAVKVLWKSEFSDYRLAPCDLYERALDIEAADHLPVSFKKEEDGSFIAAIYQKTEDNDQPDKVLYMILDLSHEQKYCLEDFSIFVRQSRAMIKTVRMRSFHTISKVRIWRTFKQSTGWEYLNACEMDVLDALHSHAKSS
ncbi:MAG TPA: hypothetical protein VE954_34380 [Oligoflexus sp.]|uniref:hypothetical protein n=1 Tax=Oligoflexus sp. TaxID=1971216 RepID=UPI002D2BA2B7|nr:hypothetical protein [Oligoflexus sp.]HYX38217.1 hypothetical protein [Oligoflexus sp.]